MVEEKELYKELGVLTKEKNKWKENIPYVSSLLDHQSVKIQAKALWLLAEMGLEYTVLVKDAIPDIVSFCDSQNPLLRERAINALGRIGKSRLYSSGPRSRYSMLKVSVTDRASFWSLR